MTTKTHEQLPTLGAFFTPEKAPIAQELPAGSGYEPPRLTPAGNLLELLGKSGPLADYRERRFHQKRP